MVGLADVQGSSLVPDLTGALNLALNTFGTPESREDRQRKIEREDEEARRRRENEEEQARRRRELEDLLGTISDPAAKKSPKQAALLRIQALDPKIGKPLLDVIKFGNAQDREEFRLEAERGAKQALFVGSQTDFAAKQRAIRSLATQAAAQGKPLDRFIELQNLSEQQLDLELQRMKIAGSDLQTILKPVERFEPVLDGQGNIVGQRSGTTGRVVSDPRAASSVERFEPVTDSSGNVVAQRNVATGKVVADPRATGKQNAGKPFLLPDGRTLMSFDGGRTAADPRGGEAVQIPSDAVPLGPETAAKEARAAKVRASAIERLARTNPALAGATTQSAFEAASEFGTGPLSNLMAATDAVVGGGLNLDSVFPKTGDNRQRLRLLKQTGKAALLNSARGAVWEQQKIDQLFPNPDTFWANPSVEARKIPLLRETLTGLMRLNDESIASGVLGPKDIDKRLTNNLDIRRTLSLLGPEAIKESGKSQITSPQTQADFDALPSGAIFIDPGDGSRRRKR